MPHRLSFSFLMQLCSHPMLTPKQMYIYPLKWHFNMFAIVSEKLFLLSNFWIYSIFIHRETKLFEVRIIAALNALKCTKYFQPHPLNNLDCGCKKAEHQLWISHLGKRWLREKESKDCSSLTSPHSKTTTGTSYAFFMRSHPRPKINIPPT